MTGRRIAAGLLLTGAAGPAWAECTGGDCYGGFLAALIAMAVYGLLAIVFLVLLLRKRWRRFGLRALVPVLLLTVGVPLASQAWQRMVLWRVESREVLGTPPPLELHEPLVIVEGWGCRDNPCGALLAARGSRGMIVLPIEALEGLDLSRPLDLAALPLQLWREGAGEPLQRGLTAAERTARMPQLDYLFVLTDPFYRREAGAVEAALQAHPALQGLGPEVLVRLGMAPLPQGTAQLDFAGLEFDMLDLSLISGALGLPLVPGHRQRVQNDRVGLPETIRSICPDLAGEVDWPCANQVERQG